MATPQMRREEGRETRQWHRTMVEGLVEEGRKQKWKIGLQQNKSMGRMNFRSGKRKKKEEEGGKEGEEAARIERAVLL